MSCGQRDGSILLVLDVRVLQMRGRSNPACRGIKLALGRSQKINGEFTSATLWRRLRPSYVEQP
jgi:hypothetical protein